MKYKNIKKCRCCGEKNLKTILNLNEQPLANSYHIGEKLNFYPLKLKLCTDCFHSQLSIVVEPDEMFKNYLYLSSTSKTLDQYFSWFADMVQDQFPKKGNILDIACNDGTQLSKFKSRGWNTYGIDPASNLHSISSKNCDKVIEGYFCEETVKKLNCKYDVIIAQNVFAHVHDIYNFLNLCKSSLKEGGKIYIQTSQADMIDNNQFDTIYHEHLSFFSTKSMIAICKRVGLFLNSVKITPIHGDSYLFILSNKDVEDGTVSERLKLEKERGRYDLKRYMEYKKNVTNIVKSFKKTINEYYKKGYLIVGYGAAAKGNTFLNYANVKLHYIIDDNKIKQNLLTPGTNCIILDKDMISSLSNNVLFVPLAWNFYSEIKQNLSLKINSLSFKHLFKYKIYRYYPDCIVEDL